MSGGFTGGASSTDDAAPHDMPTKVGFDRTLDFSDVDHDDAPGPYEFDESVPPRIGRFAVLDRLGKGGMGMVFVGYDVELDRKLAIKLLLPERGGTALRTRLMREAQAMARLSHPNVVQVYDVGSHAGRVFIAMEFVRGQTLTAWLEQERSLEAILSVFTQAGRGLAAAHRAGLVHRDFKPDNVMVGDDGRVRVLDFGIAAERGRPSGKAEPKLTATGEQIPVEERGPSLTRTGTIMGTPAYMSPEQHLGMEAGPASDQFSFCVALWSAVYGEAPFPGKTLAALMASVTSGQLRDAPEGKDVPARLHAALVRGLAVEPEDRFVGMNELLAELELPPPRRARQLGLGFLLLLTIGVAFLLRRPPGAVEAAVPCANTEAKLEAVWSDDRREAIASAFERSGVAYADDTWARIRPKLERYATSWVGQRRAACEATHVDKEQSDALLDRRMRCYDERRAELDAVLELFERADADIVRAAVTMVPTADELQACTAATILASDDPGAGMEPETVRELEALTAKLARADAHYDAGKYSDALLIATGVRDGARALGLDRLEAKSQALIGMIHDRAGDFPEAQAALLEAYYLGLATGADKTAVTAAAQLVFVLGERQGRLDEGLGWERPARALIERLASGGHDPREVEAVLDNSVGVVLKSKGDVEGAQRRYESALATRRAMGADPLRIAALLNNVSLVAKSKRDYETATATIEEALGILERELGPNHPELIAPLSNAGVIANLAGDIEGARAHYVRAIEIGEVALGPQHAILAHPITNLGALELDERNYASARKRFEAAIAIHDATRGRNSLASSIPRFNLAEIAQQTGDHEQAIEDYEITLVIDAAALGEDHPSLSMANLGIGVSALELGNYERARAELERAAELAATEPDEYGLQLADATFRLGIIALAHDGDRKRATELVHRALTLTDHAELVAEFQAWMREHDIPDPEAAVEPNAG